MPPPNLTIGTAIVITELPYEVTTDPENSFNELWYAYDATDDDEPCIGMLPKATGTYFPLLSVWLGPPGSEVEHPAGFGFYSDRRSIMVPVEGGTRYYIKIEMAGGSYSAGQTFTLRVYQSPALTQSIGDIFVPDDTDGFPGIMLDPDDGTVIRHVLFPFTERADVLPSGVVLAQDAAGDDLVLFSPTLEAIATLTGFASPSLQVDIRTNGVDKFYATAGSLLRTVDATGAIGGTTWTLTASSIAGIAPDRTDSILYYAHTGISQPIRRWDLVNNVALSNLAAAVTNYFVGEDIFVLADGTILVRYEKTSGGVDHFIRRYNPDGTTAQTYAFGTTKINRMAWAIDDGQIWVWIQASLIGTFRLIELAGGTTVSTFTQYDFVGGVSEEAPTAFPQRFGHSFSCPFFILRVAGAAEGALPQGVIGPLLWIHKPRRIPELAS